MAYSLHFKTSTILISILVIGSEVVQLVLHNYFTFDILDVIAAVIAFILSTFQMKRIAYEKES